MISTSKLWGTIRDGETLFITNGHFCRVWDGEEKPLAFSAEKFIQRWWQAEYPITLIPEGTYQGKPYTLRRLANGKEHRYVQELFLRCITENNPFGALGTQDPHGPIMITVGGKRVGVLMPVKVGDDPAEIPEVTDDDLLAPYACEANGFAHLTKAEMQKHIEAAEDEVNESEANVERMEEQLEDAEADVTKAREALTKAEALMAERFPL
jgi:HAMP domain-containing protein